MKKKAVPGAESLKERDESDILLGYQRCNEIKRNWHRCEGKADWFMTHGGLQFSHRKRRALGWMILLYQLESIVVVITDG